MFLKQKSPTLYVGDPNLLKNTVFVAPTVQEKSQWAIVYVIKRQTLGLFSLMLCPLVVAHFCSADSEGCERFGVLSFYDWSPNK